MPLAPPAGNFDVITSLSFIEDARNTLQCLSPQAVVAAVNAGQHWNDRRDIPDVVAFGDLAHAPDRTVRILASRLADGQLTGPTYKMPVAKADPSKSDQPLRWGCVLDPVTELGIRLHMSACVDIIEARARAIGDDVVCAGRVGSGATPAGWFQLEPSYLLDRRGAAIVDLVQDAGWYALGLADVKNCYPSLTAAAVCGGLSDSGVPDAIVEPIRQLMLDLGDLYQYKGLPIGPEWAPLLANAALFALDDRLQAAGIRHQRWIDDVAFLFDGLGWSQARSTFESAAHQLGLEPNYRKYAYIKDRTRALAHFVDPLISEMQLAATNAERLEIARRVHADAVTDTSPQRDRRLKFSLGVMSGHGAIDGIAPVMSNPDLLAVAPRHYGRYLKRMVTDGAVDLDWVVDRAATRRTDRDAIGQLHLLRTCAATPDVWSDQHAVAFLACADDAHTPSPVRAWAAAAYATTSAFKPKEALERAEDTGNTHLQPAWTLALARRPGGRKVKKGARRLQQAYPHCGPAAQLVLDA